MVSPSDHVETPAWDSPPHLMGNSIVGILPVYEDELPETLHIAPYHSDLIPGSFAFRQLTKWQLRLE